MRSFKVKDEPAGSIKGAVLDKQASDNSNKHIGRHHSIMFPVNPVDFS